MTALPQPNDAFDWAQASAGPALVCRPLADIATHLFTTRAWALGSGPQVDDAEPWADVAIALRCDAGRLVRVRQVHGADVLVAREASGLCPEADIIVSGNPALALAVAAADCVPLLIADRRNGAVAAAHAGWRGTAAGVAGAAVAALTGTQEPVGIMAKEFAKRRKYVVDRLRAIPGITCTLPEGAFYVFPRVSSYFGAKWQDKKISSAMDLSLYLLQEGKVALVAGEGFGSSEHVRISYATSMKNLEQGLNQIEAALKRLLPL